MLMFRQNLCIFLVVEVMIACGQHDFYTIWQSQNTKAMKKAGQWARNQNTYPDC